MRVLVLINPKSRRGDRLLPAVRAAFETANCDVIVQPMGRPGAGTELAGDGADNVDCVVIGGGDGTIINALPAVLACKLPLGIIPLGTFNDLAHTLGIPLDPEQAVATVLAGHLRTLDVGRVNGKFYYVNEASIGVSTRIARRQTTDVKKRFGFLAVAGTTLTALRYSRPFSAEVTYDDKEERFRTIQLTIANSHRFGGFITNKEAAIDDGMLDLYSLELEHWRDVLPLIKPIVQGRIAESPSIRARRATRFTVRTRRPHHVFTDGEPACMTPATFEVVPSALRVFVPAEEPKS